jgi:uncharacterized BrkB/YihY/UPF0761 family membrane protein
MDKESAMENEKKFKTRAFISITLFFFIIILALTGTTIQIVEDMVETSETFSGVLNNILHSATAIHVLTGFSFAILSVIHIILNWKVLINHLRKKSNEINKEAVFAFLLVVIEIITGIVVGITVFGGE